MQLRCESKFIEKAKPDFVSEVIAKISEELKQDFIDKGNLEIYKGRVVEASKNLKWQSNGEMVRYLYYVDLK